MCKLNNILALLFEPFEGESALIAHLPTPSGGAMVVFPSKRSAEDMVEPGWYLVSLTFVEERNIALADPVMTEANVQAASDLLNGYFDLEELRHTVRRRRSIDTLPAIAAVG